MLRIAVLPRIVLIGILLLAGTGRPATAAGGPGWVSLGPQGGSIFGLVVDPGQAGTVYAATYAGGVWKSTNGGRTWRAANDGLGNYDVKTLAIDPETPATLYAGTLAGVFKTTDGAAHWAAANTGLHEEMLPSVYALAVDPTHPATLYAGTPGLGIFKSTDGAATWQWIPDCDLECNVDTLAVDPLTPTTVYMGGMNGVFKSMDGGLTWAPANQGLNNAGVARLAIDPNAPAVLYGAGWSGGLFKTTDGAASWVHAETGLDGVSWVEDLAVDPAHPGTVYAATRGYDSAVYKSTDWAEHWTGVYDEGAPNLAGQSVAVAPSAPDTVYAGFYDDYATYGMESVGMAKSADGGATWTDINTGLTNTHINLLAVDPLDPATLYAASESDGVFKSTDGGATWAQRVTGLEDWRIWWLQIDPLHPDTLYAVGANLGAFKSTDGAASWTRINAGFGWNTARQIALDPLTPTTLYATATGPQGLFKSIDGGANWTAAGLANQYTLSVAVDPVSTSTVYVGTQGGGVWKSEDGAATWAEANTGLECGFYGQPYEVLALVIDPVTPATVYAGGSECGVFKSEDHGGHWTQISLGLPLDPDFTDEYLDVAGLAIDPQAPNTLYAAVSAPIWYYAPARNGGVFKSVNGGASWSAVEDGLPRYAVNGVTFSAATHTLYAATTGGGVFAIQQLPSLASNYGSGAPGSYFTLTGADFPPNATATVAVNGHVLGTAQADELGNLGFLLRTHATTQEGFYTVSASVTASAAVHLTLDADLETHPQEGSGPIFDVPDGIAHLAVFLPLVVKQAQMDARTP